ncbi:pinin family protein, partial [Aspergillus glaucus CBS 516.65]
LASAVSLPDQDTVSSPPAEPTLKRKSSITDPDAKRRRLSSHSHASNDANPNDHEKENLESGREQKQRRGGRRDEERKRGQRLFGALLGTLSQSSNSTAQRRRADIERRQQDKLKVQDEEYDELKKKRREERLVIRKKEQKLYEEEAMRTRHSNLLAMARFLKTRTEPVLYYKPWELQREDEDIIQDQIEDTEKTVAREVAEFEARYPPPQQTEEENPPETKPKPQVGKEVEEDKPADHPAPVPEVESERKNETREPQETTHEASDRVDAETNRDQSFEDNNQHARTTHEPQPDPSEADHPDDGGEVVEEDNEDTVIY